MKAMILKEFCELEIKGEPRKNPELPLKEEPLELVELPAPVPGPNDILVKVSACGVCHTELDEIEGRLVPPEFPIILGHEIVGRVEGMGSEVKKFKESKLFYDDRDAWNTSRFDHPGTPNRVTFSIG